MFEIKKATLKDLHTMIPHAKKFTEFYGIEWDEESVRNLLITLIENGFVYLAFHGNTLVGGIGGMLMTNPWNKKQTLLQEMFWWVDEKYRGSTAGLRLLHCFENSFNGHKVLSVLPQTPIKENMLNKLGYSVKEFVFVKE